MQYKFLQWDAKSAVPRVVSVVAAQLGPISPNSLPGTSHAYQVYSGTFVLGILWHSLHQAFASSAWACPQSTSPVAFRTFAGVCFWCCITAVRPLEGRKGRPCTVFIHCWSHRIVVHFAFAALACTCFLVALHVCLNCLHSPCLLCAHKGPLECLHSLPNMFILPLLVHRVAGGLRLPGATASDAPRAAATCTSRVLSRIRCIVVCKFRLAILLVSTVRLTPRRWTSDQTTYRHGPVRALCHEDVWPMGLACLRLSIHTTL
jgi:hypothetical protein